MMQKEGGEEGKPQYLVGVEEENKKEEQEFVSTDRRATADNPDVGEERRSAAKGKRKRGTPKESKHAIKRKRHAEENSRPFSTSRSTSSSSSKLLVDGLPSKSSSSSSSSKKRKTKTKRQEGGAHQRGVSSRSNKESGADISSLDQQRKAALAARGRAKRSHCKHQNCTKYAVKGGVCVEHGARVPRCQVEGCGKCAVREGVCVRHGAKVKRARCKHEGCEKYSVKQGVCVSHGASVEHPRCKVPNCTKYAQRSGVCVKHGAKPRHLRCQVLGCLKYAKSGGFCISHGTSGSPTSQCTIDGCTGKLEDPHGELCRKHARQRPRCSLAGCSKYAKTTEGFCLEHKRRASQWQHDRDQEEKE